ncbi:MAG TPA: hypothetical protein VNA88_11425 [Candidatus Kapabacteria bacterium]|nr:hypothetical protein [Candidatus Kapabacteria bacterium]
MFERVITQTIQRISSDVLRDRQSVPLIEILEDERIPSRFKPFFATEVRWWLYNDALARSANKRFDVAHPEVASLLDYLEQVMFRHARFEHDEFVSTLDGAVKLTFNYLCRPQTTLKWYIFRGQPVKPLSEVMLRFESFLDYEYIGNVFAEWVERKVRERATFEAISATEFERIIRRIDDQILLSCTVDELLGLLDPIFDFIGEGDERNVPLDALIIFFDDKNIARLVDHLERYRESDPLVSRARFVGILEELLTSAEENPEADFSSVYQNDELDDIVQRHLEAEGKLAPNPPAPDVAAQPIAVDSIAENPIADEPVAADFIAANPIVDEPVAADSIAENPIADESLADAPIVDEPTADHSIEENPIADEPIAEELIVDESADADLQTDAPPLEEQTIDELIAAESIAEERFAEEADANEKATGSGSTPSSSGASRGAIPDEAIADDPTIDESDSDDWSLDDEPSEEVDDEDLIIGDDFVAVRLPAESTEDADDIPDIEFDDEDDPWDVSEPTRDEEKDAAPIGDEPTDDKPSTDEPFAEPSDSVENEPDIVEHANVGWSPLTDADRVGEPASIDDVVSTLEASAAGVDEVAANAPSGAPALQPIGLDPMLERKVLKKVFNRDRAAYDEAMARLSTAETWRQASQVLDELFIRFDVDPYSRTALRFTDSIYTRYVPKSHN